MGYDAELTSPFLSWSGTVKNFRRFVVIAVAWILFWLLSVFGLVYAYAVMLPQYIGFEAALLGGIGLIILMGMAE